VRALVFIEIVSLLYRAKLDPAANREGQRAAPNLRHLPAFRVT
jgi:hypothetical protein